MLILLGRHPSAELIREISLFGCLAIFRKISERNCPRQQLNKESWPFIKKREI